MSDRNASRMWSDTKAIWALAGPAVALNSLQTVNSLLDNWFVQRLSEAALTAMGGAINVAFLLMSMSMALGIAATAIVSRSFGAKDHEQVVESAQKCLNFSVLCGLLFAVLAIPGAYIAAALFIPPDNLEAKKLLVQYLFAFAVSLPAWFAIQSIAGSLRGVGDSLSPMVISGCQILLHIVLNYVLMFPPSVFGGITIPGANLGLAGAGWAYCGSAWICALMYLAWMARTPLRAHGFAIPNLEWSKRIFNLASSAAVINIFRTGSLMIIMAILTRVPDGSLAIAGVRPGFSIEAIAFMPAFGLGVSASALVGQMLGAKKPDEAARLGMLAAHHAAIVSAFAAVVMFVFAEPLSRFLLHDSPNVIPYTADYLRWISTTEVLFAYAMVLTFGMQGAGDTRRPLILTAVSTVGIRVPVAFIAALPLGLGAKGCWIAMAATQAVTGIGALWMWKQGKWKTAKV